MKTFILAILLFFVSCGKDSDNNIYSIQNNRTDEYIPVALAKVHISQNNGVTKLTSLFINYAYAAVAPVSYILAPSSSLVLNTSGLSPILTGDVLDIGSLIISEVSTNDLKVCGGLKCNSAMLRLYTQAVSGFSGISGMINTTDGYGVDITTSGQTVGLDVVNSISLQTISIPGNKNRIRTSDFTNLSHEFDANFSNAGVGNYEVILVVELALARI